MGKEVKIGLAVITVLLGVFGFVLYQRIASGQLKGTPVADAPTEAGDAAAAKPATTEKLSSSPAKFSSGPLKQAPTMLAGEKTPAQAPSGDSSTSANLAAGANYSSSAGSRYASTRTQADGNATSGPPSFSGGATGGDALGQFSTGGDGSARSSRYSNRYADPQPAANQFDTSGSAATPRTADGQASDPFPARTAAGSSALAGDAASAALVQAVDPGNTNEATAQSVEATNELPSNPLRAGTPDADPASKADDVGSRPTSRYSTTPRSYDLYGDSPTSTASASTPAAAAAHATQPPAAKTDTSSGSAFRAAAPSRYASSTSSGSIAADNRPVHDSGFKAVSREPATLPVTPSDRFNSTSTPAAATSASSIHRPAGAAAHHVGETYTVEPNDNFWTISEKVYGTGNYYQALQEHNRGKHPRGDLLKTGDVLSVPSVETLSLKYPALCPKAGRVTPARPSASLSSQRRGGRTYVVEQGDTLFDIARFELGKATRWAEIYELNKDVIGSDFDHLSPGTELVLPGEAAATDSFTRRPAAGIQR